MEAPQTTEKFLVQFNVVCYETGHTKYEVVEFPVPVSVFEMALTEDAKFSRIDEYIAECDKSEMMYERNWQSIIDWDFEVNEETIKKIFLSLYGHEPEVLKNIDVAYTYMKDSISNLSPQQQIKIVHSAILLSLAGIKETLDSWNRSFNKKIE